MLQCTSGIARFAKWLLAASCFADACASPRRRRGRERKKAPAMEAPKRVYDALDAGNYKQALKLCEKNERNPVLVALKALTLQRLGRRDEADRTCSLILARGVANDDNVLTPLTMTLNALRRYGDATKVWTDAFEGRPDEEHLGRELAKAHLKEGAFGKLRTTAQALYKGTKKAEYLWWCGAAGVLEHRFGGPGGALGLKLGEKLAAKALGFRGGCKGASAEELELVGVLRREAGDEKGAVAAVADALQADSDAAPGGGPGVLRRPEAGDLRRAEARGLLASGGAGAAAAKFWELVERDREDWDALEGFVVASRRAGNDPRPALGGLDGGGRGPALALLEAARLDALDGSGGDELEARVAAYEKAWGGSPSCFEDLEVHAAALVDLDVASVAAVTLEEEPADARRRATRGKLARFRRAAPPAPDASLAAAEAFRTAARACDDAGTARDLDLLCAYALRDVGTAAAALTACRVLGEAHARDEAAAGVALAYVDALAAVGAGEAALRVYGKLGVKQIQLDSLGYLLWPWTSHFGFFTELQLHCRNILHLHETARRDADEFAFRALTHGNFARCVELQTFQRRRLDASATRHLARAELFTTELVLHLHAPSDARRFFDGDEADAPPLALAATAASFEAASVNCDFRVRDAWREGRSRDAAARAGETLRKQIGAAAATRDLVRALVVDRKAPPPETLAALRAHVAGTDGGARCADPASHEAGRRSPWLAHAAADDAWAAAVCAYEAAAAALGGATDGAALDALTTALDACAARVAAGGGDGVEAVAESITTAAVVLHRAVAPACVVLLSLDEGDGGKKAKGKKKKKGGADATPARAALDGALAALAALLRAARTALRALLSAADDGPPALPPPLLAGLDDGALAEALRSSRKISLDRLLEVASAKLAALQAAGVK